MSGGWGRPAGESALLRGLSTGLFNLAFAGMFMLLVLGPAYFGPWLYQPYDAALDWGANGGVQAIGIAAGILLLHYAPFNRGWRGTLPGFAAAAVVEAMLAANLAAVAVLLWAVSPDAASGLGGQFTVLIIAFVLTLPVMQGALRLTERWRAADMPWREWFRSENFRRTTMLGGLLGLVGFFLCVVAGALLESWLGDVYPGAGGFYSSAAVPEAMLVMMALLLTGPSDKGTVLRSLLVALVVLETAFAAKIAMAVVATTLQSDNPLLLIANMAPTIAVLIGAMLLVACKPLNGEARQTIAEPSADP